MTRLAIRLTLLALFLFGTTPAMARVALSDGELCRITARAPGDPLPEPVLELPRPEGIFSGATLLDAGPHSRIRIQFNLDIESGFDVLYYADPDEQGFASVTDVFFHMRFSTPDDGGIQVLAGSLPSLLDPTGPPQTRLRVSMDRVSARLVESRIGAIRIGNAPGEGKSLGSLSFGPGETIVSGTFEITPSP